LITLLILIIVITIDEISFEKGHIINNFEDFPNIKERMIAFWNRGTYDRVVLQVCSPKKGIEAYGSGEIAPHDLYNFGFETEEGEGPDKSSKNKYVDIDFMIDSQLRKINSIYYAGEALPFFYSGWVPGNTLLFGCTPVFRKDTIWIEPAPVGNNGFPSFEGWQNSYWYKWQIDSMKKIARSCKGRYFIFSRWGNLAPDTIAVVRGMESFLIDFIKNRKWVKFAMRKATDAIMAVSRKLWELKSPQITKLTGSMSDIGVWSPGKVDHFEADMSYNISNQDFKELVLPYIIEPMQLVDHKIYHLDGNNSLRHLDTILSVAEIDAVQWCPTPGYEAISQWVPLIERIQSKGKSIILQTIPEEIKPLLKRVKTDGLCIQTYCKTEDEAKSLISQIEKLF